MRLATVPVLVCAAACQPLYATNTELRMAINDVVATGEAASLEDGVLEITTDFTLADGLDAIVAEVRAFLESQVPCSTVTAIDEHTLELDFGTIEDACAYRGRTFAGVVTVSYGRLGDTIIVTHDYDGFTDGRTTIDGSANVAWQVNARRIEAEFAITGPRGTFSVESERLQTWFGDGIRVDGRREWHGPSGDTVLDILDVEMRAVDPVPQDGAYVLTTPRGREITMTFDRKDEDTITVTVSGGRRDRVFEVSRSGEVDDLGDK